MLHEGPWDSDASRSRRGGPRVLPGAYEARLTVDGQSYTQRFNVLADPRINGKVSLEDMAAQLTLSIDVMTVLDTAKKTVAKIQKQRKEFAALVKDGKATEAQKAMDARMGIIESRLVTKEGAYEQPKLVDQLNYLRQQLDQADQRPGKDLYARYEELKKEWAKVSAEYVAVHAKM
jgi:hypothetical protein